MLNVCGVLSTGVFNASNGYICLQSDQNLCLGISPGDLEPTVDSVFKLQLKRRVENEEAGTDYKKTRWDISNENGTIRMANFPLYLSKRDNSGSVYVSNTVSIFNLSSFDTNIDGRGFIALSTIDECLAVMQCNEREGSATTYCKPQINKEVNNVNQLKPGAYVRFKPCDGSFSQTFRQRLDCNQGCPPSAIGDGVCNLACNVTACNFDDGDCVPTSMPTASPHNLQTLAPLTNMPTMAPRGLSQSPTEAPTTSPHGTPQNATNTPTKKASQGPSESPSYRPSHTPTTTNATAKPTLQPRAGTQAPQSYPARTESPTQSPIEGETQWWVILLVFGILLCCCFVAVVAKRGSDDSSPDTVPSPPEVGTNLDSATSEDGTDLQDGTNSEPSEFINVELEGSSEEEEVDIIEQERRRRWRKDSNGEFIGINTPNGAYLATRTDEETKEGEKEKSFLYNPEKDRIESVHDSE